MASAESGESKPTGEEGAAANPEHINLKVRKPFSSGEVWVFLFLFFGTAFLLISQVMGQDGNIVQFKIKKHTALKKLMSTYCERAGLALQVALLAKLVFFTFQKYG